MGLGLKSCWLIWGVAVVSAGAALAQTSPPNPAQSLPEAPAPAQIQTPAEAQTPAETPAPASNSGSPIAIVSVEGVKLTGALEIADGKAAIGASGSITAGERTATVMLPRRGNLRICATTKVTLTADAGVARTALDGATAPPDPPALMMALDRGALEANFATGPNSDVILTPDFRILISGPGVAAVRVRLGPKGDTCVDNQGPNAPYVTVSSIFAGGVYRVQTGQRVMFQHGSLSEVVDNEKEPCGCPAEPKPPAQENEFPLAQSAGLAPAPKVPPNAPTTGVVGAQATAKLSYQGDKSRPNTATVEAAPTVHTAPASSPENNPKPGHKRGFFGSIGHFFKKVFGG